MHFQDPTRVSGTGVPPRALPRSRGESFPREFRVGDLCRRVAALLPRRLENRVHNFNIVAIQSVAAEDSVLIAAIALDIPVS